jgi:hypothetical protein
VACRASSGTMIRDTIYLDGGIVGWLQNYKDGRVETVQGNCNSSPGCGLQRSQRLESAISYQPYLYYINLTQPFTQAEILPNASTLIRTSYRPKGNIAPRVTNGHLLANDYEFMLYGGVMTDTDSITMPKTDWALAKDLYQHGDVALLDPGEWRYVTLENITRNIAAGAYVSVPSEDLAFVFGGSRVGSTISNRSSWLNFADREKNGAKSEATILVNSMRQISSASSSLPSTFVP